MEYTKVAEGVFEEKAPSRRVEIREINSEIDVLQAQKLALVQPSNEELMEFAKLFHPYFVERDKINTKIDELRALKQYLNSL